MSDVESELRELRAKRAGTVSRVAKMLEDEARTLDTEIEQVAPRVEAERAAEAAALQRAATAALHDAVAHFCNHAAELEGALANAVDPRDREGAVLEVIKAITSLQAELRPPPAAGPRHRYHFGNPEHTLVVRDDGVSITWPADVDSIGNIRGGRVVEEFRIDDFSRKIAPHPSPNCSPAMRARAKERRP